MNRPSVQTYMVFQFLLFEPSTSVCLVAASSKPVDAVKRGAYKQCQRESKPEFGVCLQPCCTDNSNIMGHLPETRPKRAKGTWLLNRAGCATSHPKVKAYRKQGRPRSQRVHCMRACALSLAGDEPGHLHALLLPRALVSRRSAICQIYLVSFSVPLLSASFSQPLEGGSGRASLGPCPRFVLGGCRVKGESPPSCAPVLVSPVARCVPCQGPVQAIGLQIVQ